LQRGKLVVRDGDAAEVAKASGDTVNLAAFFLDTLDDGARSVDALNGVRGQVCWRVRPSDSGDLAQREPETVVAKRDLPYIIRLLWPRAVMITCWPIRRSSWHRRLTPPRSIARRLALRHCCCAPSFLNVIFSGATPRIVSCPRSASNHDLGKRALRCGATA
jgi:hypothetical protein